jgi:hypothetical protein
MEIHGSVIERTTQRGSPQPAPSRRQPPMQHSLALQRGRHRVPYYITIMIKSKLPDQRNEEGITSNNLQSINDYHKQCTKPRPTVND